MPEPLPSLDALRILVEFSESSSLREASARLAMPRSTVRRRLQQLEQELGAELLLSSGVAVRLTPLGREIAMRSRELLLAARALVDGVRDARSRAMRLRIALPSGFSWTLVEPLLSEADIATLGSLTIEVVNVDRAVHALNDGFDLVVAFERPSSPSLLVRRFGPIAWRCCVSETYVRHHGRPAHPRDLCEHRVVALSLPGCPGPRSWPLSGGGAVEIAPWFVANGIDVVRQMVSDGRAVGLLPFFTRPTAPIEWVLDEGEHAVGLDGEVFLVTPQRLDRTPAGRHAQALVESLRRSLRKRSAVVTRRSS